MNSRTWQEEEEHQHHRDDFPEFADSLAARVEQWTKDAGGSIDLNQEYASNPLLLISGGSLSKRPSRNRYSKRTRKY